MILSENINLLGVKAESFPDKIKPAFSKLFSHVKPDIQNNFYGLSWMEGETMIYYAAVLSENVANREGLTPFCLKAGNYLTQEIANVMANTDKVPPAFTELYKTQNLDFTHPAIEHYFNEKDVRLMLKLA